MAENHSFSVLLEPRDGGGFTLRVAVLPEVLTEGDDEKEAPANAEDAIRCILMCRRGNGTPSPASSTSASI